MIQRVQSIYLLLAFIVTGALPFVFHLWKLENNQTIYFMSNFKYTALFG